MPQTLPEWRPLSSTRSLRHGCKCVNSLCVDSDHKCVDSDHKGVESDHKGVDSDQKGVEVLPRAVSASQGPTLRQRIVVQPFPESGLARFGVILQKKDWVELEDTLSSTQMVDKFQAVSEDLVDM